MDIKSMRKTVSISCSYEELELLEKLKEQYEVGTSDVFRRGLVSMGEQFGIDISRNKSE